LTIEEYIANFKAVVEEIQRDEEPIVLAVKDTTSLMAVRIFEDGLDASGAPIGQYNDTKEMWIADENLPKKGNNTGKTGKPIKTSYYESYKAMREQQGRESGFMNLRLTGRLQSEFLNAPISERVSEGGEPLSLGGGSYGIAVSGRSRSIVDKYPNVFAFSEKEMQNYEDVLTFEILNRL
jgi:hypothetical protein